MKTQPWFDNLEPLKFDRWRFRVYQQMTPAQRFAFGRIGRQFARKVEGISKPAAFHLTFRLVELCETMNSAIA